MVVHTERVRNVYAPKAAIVAITVPHGTIVIVAVAIIVAPQSQCQHSHTR